MSTVFHPQSDGQKEQITASMPQYLRLFGNHRQDDWVPWLLLPKFAVNNGMSESTKCTQFFAVHSVVLQMSFVGEPITQQDQQRLEADQVQMLMQQFHEHLRGEIRRSRGEQEDGTNHDRIPA